MTYIDTNIIRNTTAPCSTFFPRDLAGGSCIVVDLSAGNVDLSQSETIGITPPVGQRIAVRFRQDLILIEVDEVMDGIRSGTSRHHRIGAQTESRTSHPLQAEADWCQWWIPVHRHGLHFQARQGRPEHCRIGVQKRVFWKPYLSNAP